VIGAAFGTLLVAAVSLATLKAEGFLTAASTTMALPAIAVATQIKHRTAGRKVAEALAKEFGTGKWHQFG
jgi:hypothetical protein